MNKNAESEPVQYRDKRTQSGTGRLQYRTEIQEYHRGFSSIPVSNQQMAVSQFSRINTTGRAD
jgi:hypothetical protein